MNEEKDTDTQSNPPTSGRPSPGRGRGKQRRGKRGGGRGNAMSPPAAPVEPKGSPSVDSGFSGGNEVLESVGLSISGRIEQVTFVPRTEGYFKLVEAAYAELTELKQESASKLSLAEWRHIHALMLYGRIANCEFEATGYKQPAPTRISLPYDVRVFQPIFAALANLGIIEDKELFVKYIPHCIVPQQDDLGSEDVGKILDCVQYPWSESWHDVMQSRTLRRKDHKPEQGYAVTPSLDNPDELKRRRDYLTRVIADYSKIRQQPALFTAASRTKEEKDKLKVIIDGFEQLKLDDNKNLIDPDTEEEVDFTSVPDKIAELFSEAKALKFRLLRPNHRVVVPGPITFSAEDGSVVRDPGAYGRRLGWDPQLWKDYSDFINIVSPLALFSLSFPRETKGTYAWVLPVIDEVSGHFAKLPKPLPTPEWMFALILQASTLPQPRVSTWYGETDRLQYPDAVRVKYVKRAINSGMATESFR